MITLLLIVVASVASFVAGWLYRGWVDAAYIDDTGELFRYDE